MLLLTFRAHTHTNATTTASPTTRAPYEWHTQMGNELTITNTSAAAAAAADPAAWRVGDAAYAACLVTFDKRT